MGFKTIPWKHIFARPALKRRYPVFLMNWLGQTESASSYFWMLYFQRIPIHIIFINVINLHRSVNSVCGHPSSNRRQDRGIRTSETAESKVHKNNNRQEVSKVSFVLNLAFKVSKVSFVLS